MDLLTDGQFRLGVALGYRQQEYDVFGVSKEDAPGRLKEGLEVIKRLWTEDSVTFEGEHFQFEDVSIRPQPVQRPRPDIWVGASNPASVRRAARVGETFLGAHVPFDLAKKQISAFRDERPNDNLGEVGLIREAFVAETTEAAVEAVRDPLMDKYDRYVEWGQDDAIADDRFDSAWDRLAHDRFLVGSPEDVVAEIERYQTELKLDHLVIRTQFPGADFTAVEQSLQLFADEVLPEVQ
jgi:alkanesulfonate monooxygenase SsuD/methylene tetrahydromethanopterin reductase-like flavin-dependent oxidoreductase (luciferase family)